MQKFCTIVFHFGTYDVHPSLFCENRTDLQYAEALAAMALEDRISSS